MMPRFLTGTGGLVESRNSVGLGAYGELVLTHIELDVSVGPCN